MNKTPNGKQEQKVLFYLDIGILLLKLGQLSGGIVQNIDGISCQFVLEKSQVHAVGYSKAEGWDVFQKGKLS